MHWRLYNVLYTVNCIISCRCILYTVHVYHILQMYTIYCTCILYTVHVYYRLYTVHLMQRNSSYFPSSIFCLFYTGWENKKKLMSALIHLFSYHNHHHPLFLPLSLSLSLSLSTYLSIYQSLSITFLTSSVSYLSLNVCGECECRVNIT